MLSGKIKFLVLALAVVFLALVLDLFLRPAVIVLVLFILFFLAWRWPEEFFYGLIFYLPFQIALNLAADVDLLSGRVLILILFLTWWFKKPERIFSWLKNKTFQALTLFFLINLISILAAQNQFWAGRKLLVFISIFPMFILAGEIINQRKKLQNSIKLIAAGAAISSLIALGQFLSQFIFSPGRVFDFWARSILPWFSGQTFGGLVAQNPSWLVEIKGEALMRVIGLFPDPHMFAFYLGLVVPFFLAWFLLGKEHRFLIFFVCLLSLTVFLLTFSRGGYLGFLASIFMVFWLAWPKIYSEDKKFFKMGGLVILILILLVGWPIVGRFFSSFDLAEGSNLGRIAIWQDAWNVFWKNPLSGVGLGNYPLTLNPYSEYRSPVTSHNLYLDILVESGIFGFLAWLWFLLEIIKAAWVKIKSGGKEDLIVGLGCLGAIIYFSVHSFFETAIFNPTVLAFLMIVGGLAVSLKDSKFRLGNTVSKT